MKWLMCPLEGFAEVHSSKCWLAKFCALVSR